MSSFIRHKLAPEKVARLIELRKAGKTQKQIAAELGISRWTVWWYTQGMSGESSPRTGFPPQPSRCMICNMAFEGLGTEIRVRIGRDGIFGPDARWKFCSWAHLREYAERREKMETPVPQ